MTKEELSTILSLKITIEPVKGCWFIAGRDWSNYTTIKKEPGHRVVYRLCVGPLISGKVICHKCDRPGCINPDHLFQGTPGDNHQDAVNKGRAVSNSYFFTRKNRIPKELREKDRWRQLVRFCGE